MNSEETFTTEIASSKTTLNSVSPDPKVSASQPNAQLTTISPLPVEPPSTWIRNGESPTEILLAAAILTSVSMGAIARIIITLTGLIKVLVPIVRQPDK